MLLSASAPAPLRVSSSPEGFGNAPSDLTVKIWVEPHDANYQLAVVVDSSQGYFRSWQEYLREPDGGPTDRRSYNTTLRDVPEGRYLISVALFRRTAKGEIDVFARVTDDVCFTGFNTRCGSDSNE